ncbi:MAG: GtrA family protein [Gammaproteobacteria bacterium]|nr:GtrA family protein [Gammaproteobacteria bacterium]
MDDIFIFAKKQNSVKQLFHYGLVGIVSNFAGYIIYLLITYFGASPKITMTILYIVGAGMGFVGNRKLTFKYTGDLLETGFRYSVVHCFGYLINLAMLIIMVDKLGYAHQWVQAIAIFVVAILLFLGFKFFVFPDLNILNKERK